MSRSILFLLGLNMATAGFTGDGRGSTRLLSSFDEADLETRWMTVNDNVMGGRSSGGLAFEDGRLVFSGATNTDGGGFSSIRMKPTSLDLGPMGGLIVRFRGDGRSYKLNLRTDESVGRMSVAYRVDFETDGSSEWQERSFAFEEFEPTLFGRKIPGFTLDPERIQSVGFMIYDGKDGPFHLEVDWIKSYK